MKSLKAVYALAIAALVLTGAAIDATAQRRKAARKPVAQPAASASAAATPAPDATPAPAKRNARPEEPAAQPAADPAASPTPAATPAAAAPVPAKKNADARQGDGAQSAKGDGGGAGRATGEEVRYSFEFKQPSFFVQRFLIEHDAGGRGRITFERRTDDQPLVESFEISPSAYARIVGAWEALRFLDSQESYQADKQFPHLGTMWLWMRRGGRERRAEFNWTNNDHAAALAREYRAIAEQQFFLFDMALARQYQPSEAIKILNRLESLLGTKQISDPSQLAPLLLDLTTDERIPLIARNHAERLLKRVSKEAKPAR
jgi:hypothetical protein